MIYVRYLKFSATVITTRHRLVVLSVVVVLLLAAGCLGAPKPDATASATATNETTDAVVDEESPFEDADPVETYRFELLQEIGSPNETVVYAAAGAVDEVNQRMYVVSSAGAADAVDDREQYVIEETVYERADDRWFATCLPETEFWGDADSLETQRDLLAAADVERVGAESIDGVETTAFRVDATEALLEEVGFADALEREDVRVQDAQYHFYVAEDTDRLHRTTAELTLLEDGEEFVVRTELTISDHGEPVRIELPPEATNASQADAS